MRVFLLGGGPGVAEGVREWLHRSAPGLDVCGVCDGFRAPSEMPGVLESIRRSKPHLLLVAMGAPRQDLWIRESLRRLGVPVVMAVGGLFDFYSGRIPRAPFWMRSLGIEWVFRLLQEPGRLWQRYLIGNLAFMLRALRMATRPRVSEWVR